MSSDRVSLDNDWLEPFAQSIGSDYTIESAQYLGTKEVTEREPVHTSGFGVRGSYDSKGRYRRDGLPWDRTVYVPVVVEADEYAWVVYYLRRR